MNTAIEWSDTKLEIVKALFEAQSKIMDKAVKKTSANEFHRSRYADLATVFDVALPALNESKILLIQGAVANDTGGINVETQLIHTPSGEWVRNVLTLKPKGDEPQPAGSAITYGRRYGLQPLLAIAPEDDDGNAASGTDVAKRIASQRLTDQLKESVRQFKPFQKAENTAHDAGVPLDSAAPKLPVPVEFAGVLEGVRQNTDEKGTVWTTAYLEKKRIFTKDQLLGHEMLRFGDCDCTVTVTHGKKENDYQLVSIK